MKNDIVIYILVLVVIVLAIFTLSLYSGANKCKTAATTLGTQLQECGAEVNQVRTDCQTGLEECSASATVCQDMLASLTKIPACAKYIPGTQ